MFRRPIVSFILALRPLWEYPKLLIARTSWRLRFAKAERNSLVSVVIPTWNRAELLVSRTLPLVLQQTHTDVEIIVVGDAMDEAEMAILRTVRDRRVKIINLRKRGKYPKTLPELWFVAGSKPMNKGLRLAKGAWICRFDDDDSPRPDFIEKSLQWCRANNLEFVSSPYIIFDEHGHEVKQVGPRDSPKQIGGHATWFYRSSLSVIRYSRLSWAKTYDRPTDRDRASRLNRYRVRTGLMSEPCVEMHPRPGNVNVGLAQHLEEQQLEEQ